MHANEPVITTPTGIALENDWAAILTGESLVFGLLSKALYSEPDEDWLHALADGDVFAESPFGNHQPDTAAGLTLLRRWSTHWHTGAAAELLKDVQADYVRLFVGPGKMLAAPWESIYFNTERLLFQQQTVQVRAWYRRYGLEAANLHKEPDDHIGLELAFVAHLAQRGLQALEQQDSIAFDDALDAQRRFLSEHLLRWAPAWCELVITHATTDFYRGIGLLTRGALIELAALLQIDRPEEKR